MNHLQPQRAETDRWSPRLLHDLNAGPDLLAAAGQLIGREVPVFPCAPGGKRPLTAHGFQDASTDPGAIASWWGRWPDANIGVPTGAASGVDVVDVDVHSTGAGFPAFEQARRAGFVEGWAWLVRTPSGGAHAYFPHGADREQRSWQVPGRHIDFRGDGGYIIVPPSRVTGDDGVSRPYRQIAIAEHHQPSAGGRGGTASLPRPSSPPARAGGPASDRVPPGQARRVGDRPTRGWTQRRAVLGRVPDGRRGARLQRRLLAARRCGLRGRPAGARGTGDHPVGVPDRDATRAGGPASPYERG